MVNWWLLFSLSSKTLTQNAKEGSEWAVCGVERSGEEGGGGSCLQGVKSVQYVRANTKGSQTKRSAHIDSDYA